MIADYVKIKSLIFDGPESEILSKFFWPGEGVNIKTAISFNDFANNNFEDLRGLIGQADFAAILKTGDFAADEGFLNLYKGSSGLRLYFCKRDNLLIVFAYGEFQPTRYLLYLEGSWTLANPA
jgi:hypothetical protein